MEKEMVNISLDGACRDRVKAGILQFAGLNCQEKNDELWQQIQALEEKYRSQFAAPSDALALLKPARDLYRKVGIEPTRIRPSSEALLRRVIKRKPLYRINSIVDVCNYCSLAFLLPIGLYDLAKIRGDVVIRFGQKGEGYPGIRKDEIHVAGRLTVADEAGPFGNPSADSLRTAIGPHSREVLMIIFAPATYPAQKLTAHLNFAETAMLYYHAEGRLVRKDIL